MPTEASSTAPAKTPSSEQVPLDSFAIANLGLCSRPSSNSAQPDSLLRPQNFDRIYGRRAASRNVTGEQRRENQPYRGDPECGRIPGFDTE
jgi:hypothetical protein